MENRALGKGLSALIPDHIKEMKPGALANLNPAEINFNQMQPRSVYDDNKLAELKASIKEKGVLQPILVRKKGDKYEVIAGERRLRAARALNMETVPAIIKEVNDDEALVLALIENIQREELNAIEEAQAYERLINQFQFTHDAVAQSVGKDRSTVTNLLRLLKLPEFIQKGIFDQTIGMGHARALLAVENSAEQKHFFETSVKKGLSVRGLENLINSSIRRISRRRKSDALSRNKEVVALEDELQKALGTRVRLTAGKKRGKIVIEYYSLEDLERILKIISKGKTHFAH